MKQKPKSFSKNADKSLFFLKSVNTSVPKFTAEQRRAIDATVASMSIKRIPDSEIIAEIKRQTNKEKISRQSLYNIRQRIKMKTYDNELEINAENEKRTYYEIIPLPAEAATKVLKSTFLNGLLEVMFKTKIIKRKVSTV